MSGKLQGLLKDIPLERQSRKREARIEQLQADLNYCQFFPCNEQYLPLKYAKDGLYNGAKGRNGVNNERAAKIWALAQKCALNGTLQDLKDGLLDRFVNDFSAPLQSYFPPSLQASSVVRNEGRSPRWKNEKSRIADKMNGSATDDELQDTNTSHSTVSGIHTTEYQSGVNVSPARRHVAELSSDPEMAIDMNQNNSESDGGLILNTYGDNDKSFGGGIDRFDQAADKVNQTNPVINATTRKTTETAMDEQIDSESEAEIESDDGDAMMDYSNSGQDVSNDDTLPNRTGTPEHNQARVLADLSPQDLNAQIRYFHVTKATTEVDPYTPVRCLVCAQHGHMAEACNSLTCNVCGSFNHHTTQNCPSMTKCSRCREIGHDKSRCPYKLKNMAPNEIVCDLCQQNGHIEDQCELVWRTSGRPWESDLSKTNVRLSCYECGRRGHLGNTCSTRRPGKSMGTSSWGTAQSHMSIRSKNELRIKGSARQDPIAIDGDDDGMVDQFVRPKVPEPVRKGKIQIKTGAHFSAHHGWNPINAPHERDRITQAQHSCYRDDDRSNWRAANNSSQPARDDYARYSSYRPSDRRSVSPGYRDGGGYGRSDRYRAPAPQKGYQSKRPQPAGDVYRPMPSSAQNAWSRHRM